MKSSRMPASPDTNTYRCFPSYWTPEGYADPQLDWFHTYVVTKIVQTDTTGKTPNVAPPYNPKVVTRYDYHDSAAWHFDDDDGIVPITRKTWSQWRGYGRVTVVGGDGSDTKTYSETRYFRGMKGDHLASGATRGVTVSASAAAGAPGVTDEPAYAGMAREQVTYLGPEGAEVSGVVNDPWQSAPTATRTINATTSYARYADITATHTRTALDGGRGYWRTDTATQFDGFGRPVMTEDTGEAAVAGDETCTKVTYPGAGDGWRLNLPSRVVSYALPCARTAVASDVSPKALIADTRTFYDNAAWNSPIVLGEVTLVESHAANWTPAAPVYQASAKSKYDPYGRATDSWDKLGNHSSTAYTPAADAPVTSVTTTNPVGWTSTATIEPAWGAARGTLGENGARSTMDYDPLGRLTKVWLPSRTPRPAPEIQYTYDVRDNAPSAVTTTTLTPSGGTRSSYTLYDSLLRARQTQSPSPVGGRVVTDTFYDTAGRAFKTYAPYYNSAAPGKDLFPVDNAATVPSQTLTLFDGAGRAKASVFQPGGVEKWRTSSSYGGDRVDTVPPRGGTVTSTFTDAQGRTTRLLQYHGTAPTGPADTTSYGYDATGRLETVTDPAGNSWTNRYDLRGNLLHTEDPDKGTTDFTFNSKDQLTSSTDAQRITLAYTYDVLGRPRGIFDGSEGGPQRVGYTYDTATFPDGTAAKGKAAAATRYLGSDRDTTAVLGYTDRYQPTGSQITVATSDPDLQGLQGNHVFKNGYNVDGSLATLTYPKKGLPVEAVAYGYNSLGLMTTVEGTDGGADAKYITDTTYSELGQLLGYTGNAPTGDGRLLQDYTYEPGTGRLQTAKTQRTTVAPNKIADIRYTYDDAGNLTQITGTPAGGQNDVQCFNQDYLRRLTDAWTPARGNCTSAPADDTKLGGPAPYRQSWTFDAAGNRRTQKPYPSTVGQPKTTITYQYPADHSTPAHTLLGTTTTTVGATGTSSAYTYDEAGNTKTRSGPASQQTLTWDNEGHLARVEDTSAGSSYIYDAAGNRLISKDATGATLYLPATELRLTKSTGQVSCTRAGSSPASALTCHPLWSLAGGRWLSSRRS